MIISVRLVQERMQKRQYMVTLQREEHCDVVFEPSKIADAISGWSTLHNVERVKLGTGTGFARLYVTTGDLNLTATDLKRGILATHQRLQEV